MILDSKYQLIFLGENHSDKDKILKIFLTRIKELGMKESLVKILQKDSFEEEYDIKSPTVALYFGNANDHSNWLKEIKKLKNDSAFILPVVDDLDAFTTNMPEILHHINGFELKSDDDLESLVSVILEGFGLLRVARRLFISYKRNESTGVAIQLYEVLEKAGFDVFLDTHSVDKGDDFQEELWHRLVDTDVVLLLNTPDFLESEWTVKELTKANSLAIGILQLIWPENTIEREAGLTIPFELDKNNFINGSFKSKSGTLEQDVIKRIISKTESLRARSLASRRDNLITDFLSTCRRFDLEADLQPHRYIVLENSKKIIIPTVGVPRAFTYNEYDEQLIEIRKEKGSEVWLLYDNRSIREKWIKHLSWLDAYLPIKSVKITEIEDWVKSV